MNCSHDVPIEKVCTACWREGMAKVEERKPRRHGDIASQARLLQLEQENAALRAYLQGEDLSVL